MAKWENPARTPTYYSWRNMRDRCSNPRSHAFHNYGGRGIRVCDRWAQDYDAFVEDMGLAPDGTSLDRIDFNGDYEPANCRWASVEIQANNKRTSRFITKDGETMTHAQWAKRLGIQNGTLHRRLKRMSPEAAIAVADMRRAWRHGTRHGYQSGCRCDECKAAHATRHREMRKRRKERACGGEIMTEVTL